MSTLIVKTTDPKELRPLLHQRLDAATDEELTAVHKVLLEMEARRLYDSLGEDFAEDWATGKLTNEGIAQSILEHRQKHPSR